jgi:hypothetical protein
MDRPILDKNISLTDFNDFYWLKEELIKFCKDNHIPSTGGKIEIADRIRSFISTGNVTLNKSKTVKKKSSFNWSTETLTVNTTITDNYKNGENVRAFFIREIGTPFSFNVIFMDWIKQNIGKTLGDAVKEWNKINELKKDKNYTSEIAPQFEYNRYMRAFLADNPNLSSKDAMKHWKLKRTKRGTNEYERTDLEMK